MYGLIEGLDETRIDDVGERYYHSNALKEVGIFIEAHNSVFEDDKGEIVCDTWIAVKQLKENDAITYTLYWQDALTEIQIYRIIKDTFEIFQQCNIELFETLMRDMSTQYQSASMQSIEENKIEMIADMEKAFEMVYE